MLAKCLVGVMGLATLISNAAHALEFPSPTDEPILLEKGLLATKAYEDYTAWLDRRFNRVIEDRAESQAFLDGMTLLTSETHGLSWWINGSEKLDYYAGGVGFICRIGSEETLSLYALASAEEVAEKCAWKLWRIDIDPDTPILNQLAGPGFDLDAATDWLSAKGIDLKELGSGSDVDWTEFPELGNINRLNQATRQTSWSVKTCPGITALLDSFEGAQPRAIDIKGYGLDAPAKRYEAGTIIGAVTVSSVGDTQISYGFMTDEAQETLGRIIAIMENCQPDS
ncbi:MAG: hypothetical protein CMK09_11845 [Ponticaulis sp.]|nr:hypothetical protein [Ponticaulis sp.]|tara:strand:- start:4985 stop:5833 length:849 start_codon:yes stop_codon:yes gene_type:complete